LVLSRVIIKQTNRDLTIIHLFLLSLGSFSVFFLTDDVNWPVSLYRLPRHSSVLAFGWLTRSLCSHNGSAIEHSTQYPRRTNCVAVIMLPQVQKVFAVYRCRQNCQQSRIFSHSQPRSWGSQRTRTRDVSGAETWCGSDATIQDEMANEALNVRSSRF